MPASRKRQQEEAAREYHDFVYQVESSARRILERSAKKRIAQAKKARFEAIRERHAKPTRIEAENQAKNPLPSSQAQAQAQDLRSTPDHLTQLKALTSLATNAQKSRRASKLKSRVKSRSQRKINLTPQPKPTSRHSDGLPLLRKSSFKSKYHGGKGGDNAWSSSLKRVSSGSKGVGARLVEISELQENADKQAERLRVKIKKIAGHFAPGTVLPRPAHEVERRLSVSAWLDPSKPVGIEKSLPPLSPSNELQGPTNWSSVDLRMKYRDEHTKEEAYQISLAQLKEAEELELLTSTVVVTEHPVKVDFGSVLRDENTQAIKTSQRRNRLKEFSYDFDLIWNVVGKRQRGGKELLQQEIPVCNGISNRRDPLAHQKENPQVQSVSEQRALQGALVGSVSSSLLTDGTAQAAVESAKRTKDNVSEELRWRAVIRVSKRGAKVEVMEDTKSSGAGFLVASVWQGEKEWRLEAYDPEKVITVRVEVTSDKILTLMDTAKRLLQAAHDEKLQLVDEMRSRHFSAAPDRIQRARVTMEGLWWHLVDTCLSYKDQTAACKLTRVDPSDNPVAAELVKSWEGKGAPPEVAFRKAMRLEGRHVLVSISVASSEAGSGDTPENVQLDDVAVVIRKRDADTMETVDVVACLGRPLLQCLGVAVSSQKQIYMSWWMTPSDWKSKSLEALVEAFSDEQFRDHIVSSHDEYFASMLDGVSCSITESMEAEWASTNISTEAVGSNDESSLWNILVSLDEASGGVGLLERLKWADKLHALTNENANPLRSSARESVEEFSTSSHMILSCRPKQVKLNQPVPSTSIRGLLQPVAAFFKKELNAQGDYPVTCVLAAALDSPLYTPCNILRHTKPLTPPRRDVDLPPSTPSGRTVPGFVQRITSSVDQQSTRPIWVLTAAATPLDYGDVGKPWERELRRDKHPTVRISPEHATDNFRVKVNLDAFCTPEPTIRPTSFGITQACVTPNAPDTWPFRYTWHSDDLVLSELCRKRTPADYKSLVERSATVGSNSPICVKLIMHHTELAAIHTATIHAITERLQQVELDAREASRLEHLKDMLQVAQKDEAEAVVQRVELEREMNEVRVERKRELTGKVASLHKDDWEAKRLANSTRRLGSWNGWQAFMWLDEHATKVLKRASQVLNDEQVNRVAQGEDQLKPEEVNDKIQRMTIREGTLFYHHSIDDNYQWEQPVGWQGIATLLALKESSSEAPLSKNEDTQSNIVTKEAEALGSEAEALEKVAHCREIRRLGDSTKEWMSSTPAFDLREPFLDSDADGYGVLRHEPFLVALAKTGTPIDKTGQAALITLLDPEETGFVDYRDFVQWSLDTSPHNAATWADCCLDYPEMTLAQWEGMAAQARKLSAVDEFEVYKDRTSSRQHFVFDRNTGEYSWKKSKSLLEKQRVWKSQEELQWTQISASLAAAAAAAAAKTAQTASATTVESLVEHLAESDHFVTSLLDRLGLRKELSEGLDSTPRTTPGLVPPLSLVLDRGMEQTDLDAESDTSLLTTSERALTFAVAEKKDSSAWNLIEPGIKQSGFITEACTPNIAKAGTDTLNSVNNPSLVGVVDPGDATYVPYEDIPGREAHMIHDVFEDAAAQAGKDGVALTKEMLLDTSGEQKLVELRHRAFQAVRNAKIEELEECMDEGVSVHDQDENGNTLLLLAAQQGLKKIVKFLLRRGADINDRNLAGNTVLHYCFQYKFNSLAEYLIAKGADDSLLNKDGMTCYEGLNKQALDED